MQCLDWQSQPRTSPLAEAIVLTNACFCVHASLYMQCSTPQNSLVKAVYHLQRHSRSDLSSGVQDGNDLLQNILLRADTHNQSRMCNVQKHDSPDLSSGVQDGNDLLQNILPRADTDKPIKQMHTSRFAVENLQTHGRSDLSSGVQDGNDLLKHVLQGADDD